jgi:hypothetical protein
MFRHVVEAAAVGHAGQAVARGQALQLDLRRFLHRHVAQGFDHGDQLAVIVVDRAGVDGEIEAGAHLRHDAPVLGAPAVGGDCPIAGVVVVTYKRIDFRGAPLGDQIGQAGARLVIEAAPVLAGADHLVRPRMPVRRSQALFQMMTRHSASSTKVGTTSCSISLDGEIQLVGHLLLASVSCLRAMSVQVCHLGVHDQLNGRLQQV